jgi:hypothetical protein
VPGGPPNLVLLWEAPLDRALAASDVAVLVNYCTTAALEAMLRGLPVVFLRSALYPVEASRDPLEAGGALSVGDVGELEAVLDRLTRDDDFRRTTLARAEPFLASFLDAGGGTAYEHIFRACDRIALPAAPPDQLPQPTHQQALARTLELLAPGRPREAFLTAWEELVRDLAGGSQTRPAIRRLLFCLSHDIGAAAKDPDELCSLIGSCYRAARVPLSLPAREERDMLANAYLAGIAHHLRARTWDRALALFRRILQDAPRAVARLARSPQLKQALAQALDDTEKALTLSRSLQHDLESLRRERQQLEHLSLSLQRDLESLRQEREQLRDRALSLEDDLKGLRGSWAWKVGRLLVRPGSLLKRAVGHGGRTPPAA